MYLCTVPFDGRVIKFTQKSVNSMDTNLEEIFDRIKKCKFLFHNFCSEITVSLSKKAKDSLVPP